MNTTEANRSIAQRFNEAFNRGDLDAAASCFAEDSKVPVKVTINGYTWCSTVANRDGRQYIVVNAGARRSTAVEVADVIPIFAGEKR